MTHYHYYITAGRQLDTTSKIYLVGVGTSRQADRDYLFLLSHATTAGHYFELRNQDTTNFVTRVQNQLNDEADAAHQPHPTMQMIKIRDLVRSIKAQVALPLTSCSLHNAHEIRNLIDGSYRAFSNLSRAASSAKRHTY